MSALPSIPPRTPHRLALVGLAAVLGALAVFGVSSAYRTAGAAKRARAATRLSDAYQRASFALGEQESTERMYRIAPSDGVRVQHADAAADFDAALDIAAAEGSARDRAAIEAMQRLHARYLQAIDALFDAADVHDTAKVAAIDARDVDPVFGRIEAQVADRSAVYRTAALVRIDQLRRTQQLVLWATAIVFVVGLGLVGFFAIVLARTHDRLRAQAEQAAYDARHDPLTGLANRSHFGARLRAAIAASRDGAPLVVMMLDLDRFKEINDTFGHGTGDTLLRAVGARLERLRGPGDVLARLGGDEFALLVRGADAAVGQELSSRVLELVSQPIALADVVVSVEASIGIVQYPEHGTDAETLLQRADVAMYLAKDRGRGKALYNPADDHHTAHRLSLAGELRRAIAEDELELHYQPKLELRGLRLAGVEALVRWRHPRHGLIPPGDFIPLAEHTAAIRPLTLLVLRKALRQLRAWGAEGLDTCVAVNLSVANLLDTQLVADLALILDEEGVAGDRLVLELTESMVMVDPERSIALLGRIAAMGIEIAVDDFGTGHASLAYLRRLPIAELKIDRVFVRDIATDAQDAAIVAATVALAHTLGLRVVAEGVEGAAALARLRELGCDSAQGYHLYRPMPAEELRDALHAAAGDERRAA